MTPKNDEKKVDDLRAEVDQLRARQGVKIAAVEEEISAINKFLAKIKTAITALFK